MTLNDYVQSLLRDERNLTVPLSAECLIDALRADGFRVVKLEEGHSSCWYITEELA